MRTRTKTEMRYYLPSVLLKRICLKMMKSLHRLCVRVCACARARAAVQSGSPGCARAQASLLQFTSITSYNPISHSIDPQNCCSPEPLAFLPIISPPLFFITQRPPPPTPPPPPSPTPPSHSKVRSRSNMNYKCMANKREWGGGGSEWKKWREMEMERSGW